MRKRYMTIILAMLLITVLAACGDSNGEEAAGDNIAQFSDEELMPEDKVIAVVNGSEILGNTYNLVYTQLKLRAVQLGKDADLAMLKDAAYESLVDREILMQQAEKEGIAISDDAANKELKNLKEANDGSLDTVMEQFRMTEADFKEQLKFELALLAYKEKVIDVKISNEELEEYYDKAKASNENMPAYEEVKYKLRGQMKEVKENEAVQENIDKIKETAEIEKKIEA